MRLALIGYGKMGRLIEELALEQGHMVVLRLDQPSDPAWASLTPAGVDVAIEFTGPISAPDNLLRVLGAGVPVVCGSTGWLAQLPALTDATHQLGGSLLYGSNFSVGVNLLFVLNKKLAALMNHLPQYDVALEERHHRQKADAPSGTALTLAADVLEGLARKTTVAQPSQLQHRPPAPEELTVGVVRAGSIPGTHRVLYTSDVDTLLLEHTAHSRVGFAEGALLAARWLQGKKGVFRFEDVFEQLLDANAEGK